MTFFGGCFAWFPTFCFVGESRRLVRRLMRLARLLLALFVFFNISSSLSSLLSPSSSVIDHRHLVIIVAFFIISHSIPFCSYALSFFSFSFSFLLPFIFSKALVGLLTGLCAAAYGVFLLYFVPYLDPTPSWRRWAHLVPVTWLWAKTIYHYVRAAAADPARTPAYAGSITLWWLQ